jgi:flagellin-like hook-associated protein FlgL
LLADTDIALLDYLDIDWGDILQQYLNILKEVYKEHKTISHLTQYSGDYIFKGQKVNLGLIIQYIRKSNSSGKLTDEDIKTLTSMGFVRNPKQADNILIGIVAYYKENGTIASIKAKDSIDVDGKTYNIGKQINHFRTKYRKGTLKPDYINKLNSMGMCWGKIAKEEIALEI